MSNSKTPEPQSEPLYILKQPYKLPNGDKWIDVSWEDFDELFKPFDGELLKQQIRELTMQYEADHWHEHDNEVARRAVEMGLARDNGGMKKAYDALVLEHLEEFAEQLLELIYPTKEQQ